MANTVMALLVEAAEEGGHIARELPVPPYVFGVTALVLFAAALAVTWAFKGLAHGH
jgi:hypothetical protein